MSGNWTYKFLRKHDQVGVRQIQANLHRGFLIKSSSTSHGSWIHRARVGMLFQISWNKVYSYAPHLPPPVTLTRKVPGKVQQDQASMILTTCSMASTAIVPRVTLHVSKNSVIAPKTKYLLKDPSRNYHPLYSLNHLWKNLQTEGVSNAQV